MNDDDEIPAWGDGENLTGDAYVKWIREVRGEEIPAWVSAALDIEGVDSKRVEEVNSPTTSSMANPKQILMIRTNEDEINVFLTSKLAWEWLKSRFQKYHDDPPICREPRIKGTMEYKEADHIWFNQRVATLRKQHNQGERNTFHVLRKSGAFLASISITYLYRKGDL